MTNLLVNSGAEVGDLTGWTCSGNTLTTGWVAVSGGLLHTGSWSFITQSTTLVSMSQDIALSVGVTYIVSFWGASDNLNNFALSIAGNNLITLASTASSFSFYSANFTATSATESLVISASAVSGNIAIDDISVSYLASNVPSAIPSAAPTSLPTVTPSAVPSSAPTQSPTSSLANGLVAHFPFDGNANDTSGNGNNGVVNSATLTTDRFGNSNSAYHFSSSSNIRVQDNNILKIGTSDYSVSAWVKIDSLTRGTVFSHGSWGCSDPGYTLLITSGNTVLNGFTCADTCYIYNSYGNNVLNLNQWYLVTATVSRSGNSIIYVNGVQDSITTGVTACNIEHTDDLYIGTHPLGNQFYGSIDDFRIYNRVLTATEVQQLYNLDTYAPTQSPTIAPSAPSVTPTSFPTRSPSSTPSVNPTKIPSFSPTSLPTSAPTVMPSMVPSIVPSALPTALPTVMPTQVPSAFPTENPTVAPTALPTSQPSLIPTSVPSMVPSSVPSVSPTVLPTAMPTEVPSAFPSENPTSMPTARPTNQPSLVPSSAPSMVPSSAPTAIPSSSPTIVPTEVPSVSPSENPTVAPTAIPTSQPSLVPSSAPSMVPSSAPTAIPSSSPTIVSTEVPSVSPSENPTSMPTTTPTSQPSFIPTSVPSMVPSSAPTAIPSGLPSLMPTERPSAFPTENPTVAPTAIPTSQPSLVPSSAPSMVPSSAPSAIPSSSPTIVPTDMPSAFPSENPTVVPTALPTSQPSLIPSSVPSMVPSSAPSAMPSSSPTIVPTERPSVSPSENPTCMPTALPTSQPTSVPSAVPSLVPTDVPTIVPTPNPTTNAVADIDIDNLGTRGFIIYGTANSQVGKNIFPIGDFDNDGIIDFIVTLNDDVPYIIYGNCYGFNNFVLNGADVLKNKQVTPIYTTNGYNSLVYSNIGDINQDGINDLMVGIPYNDKQKGLVKILYGSNERLVSINLDSFNNGFNVKGVNINDRIGSSIAGIDDVNNDKIPDILIGSQYTNYVYVIFGQGANNVDITLPPTSSQGYKIFGSALTNNSVKIVAALDDVNGDGICDYAVSFTNFGFNKGIVYILYGGVNNGSDINLDALSITQGFSIVGQTQDYLGSNVVNVDDINGDGIGDIGLALGNRAYVIYGKANGVINNIDLNNFNKENGFVISNSNLSRTKYIWYSIAGGFDANKDGRSDIVVATALADEDKIGYVIYGKVQKEFEDIDLANLKAGQANAIISSRKSDYVLRIVKNLGDIDLDGFPDFALTDNYADINGGINTGEVDIITNIFGSSTYAPTQMPNASPNPSNSPTIRPTRAPTKIPSMVPTIKPSGAPTAAPSSEPTGMPSDNPSVEPTGVPSSSEPSSMPTGEPTLAPNLTTRPTSPTKQPSIKPTKSPTFMPSKKPSSVPSSKPSKLPTDVPSKGPTSLPSLVPSKKPSLQPTKIPSGYPTITPTVKPTSFPTIVTSSPSLVPTYIPSSMSSFANTPVEYSAIIITKSENVVGTLWNDNFIIDTPMNVTITGNGGSNEYTILPFKDGKVIVRDFNPAKDVINVEAFRYIKDINDLNITLGSIIITFKENQKITLLNLVPSNINEDNFIFFTPSSQDGEKTSNVLAWTFPLATMSLLSLYGVFAKFYHKWPFNKIFKVGIEQDDEYICIKELSELESNPEKLTREIVKKIFAQLSHPTMEVRDKSVEFLDYIVKAKYNYNYFADDEIYLGLIRDLFHPFSDTNEYSERIITSMASRSDYFKEKLREAIVRSNLKYSDSKRIKDVVKRVEKLINEPILNSDSDGSYFDKKALNEILENYEYKEENAFANEVVGDTCLDIEDQPLESSESSEFSESSSEEVEGNAFLDIESQSLASESDDFMDAMLGDEYAKLLKLQDMSSASESSGSDECAITVKKVEIVYDNPAFNRGDFSEIFKSPGKVQREKKLLDFSGFLKDLKDDKSKITHAPVLVQNNDNIISLLTLRQLVEYLPLIDQLAQKSINYLGYNITIPKIEDNKMPIIFTHLVLGYSAAQYLPHDNFMNGVIFSSASSFNYAVKLVVTDYIQHEKQATNMQELLHRCGVSMTAYSFTEFSRLYLEKTLFPGSENHLTTLDLIAGNSLGIIQCYNEYRTLTEGEIVLTISDKVVPYIADAGIIIFSSQNYNFDYSSMASGLQTAKNSVNIMAVTYVTHYVSAAVMTMIPYEIKEEYLDPLFEYISYVINAGIDYINDLNF